MSVQPVEQPDSIDAAQHAADLRRHVLTVIFDAATHDPRSLQESIGPSEIGDECARRIAYKLLGTEKINNADPWRSVVGRATHAWLAETFEARDREAGGGRYLVEVPVDPGGHPGTSDLFILGPSSVDEERLALVLDRLSGTVADWKIKGATSLARLRRSGPSYKERVQLQLYGKGQVRAGERVRWVSLVGLPQSGTLRDCYVWSEPFDEAAADLALARVVEITTTVAALDLEQYPERLAAIPATPSGLCPWCPYFKPGSSSPERGCPGTTAPGGAQ